MTDYTNLFQMLENANENDTVVTFMYSDNKVSMAAEFVPDILIQDDWVMIVDKEKGERVNFSFMADTQIEYDEDTGEFIIFIGKERQIVITTN